VPFGVIRLKFNSKPLFFFQNSNLAKNWT